jgi:hypothetical protein
MEIRVWMGVRPMRPWLRVPPFASRAAHMPDFQVNTAQKPYEEPS